MMARCYIYIHIYVYIYIYTNYIHTHVYIYIYTLTNIFPVSELFVDTPPIFLYKKANPGGPRK